MFTSMILLTSCSVMSVEECKTANWRDIGYTNGTNGYDKKKLSEYESACKEGNIKPDQASYETGYRDGLKQYCTAQNIFDKGLIGKGNYRVCPVEKQTELKPYYDISHEYYRAKTAKDNLIRDIDDYEKKLKAKDLKKDKADEYKRNLSDLESKRSRVNREFYDAEDSMERFKRAKKLNAW